MRASLIGIVSSLALSGALPATSAARIEGVAFALTAAGKGFVAEFACDFASGSAGPCTGSYTSEIFEQDCSNSVKLSSQLTITGMNLSAPGTISGSIRFKDNDYTVTVSGDDICTVNPGSFVDVVQAFTGTWDGTSGTFSWVQQEGAIQLPVNGVFYGVAPPVFPMTVTSQIDATRANAQAVFQPRPQDVGASQSTYVFALAPAPRVTGVTAATLKVGQAKRADGLKTDAVPCVLAQLNAAGQLTAASASSLTALATGVLSAAGNAVTVLNNVSTPTVAGATMFVGYGPNASTMINQGINRSAVTVPGAVECRPEGPQTGWWWNTVEGGRGYSIEKQGNNLFMASYFYEANGRATWLVASGPTTLEGALFTAPLFRCSGGVTLAGAYRANACATAGEVTLAFNSASKGTMVWPGGTVGIERFESVAGGLGLAPLPNQPENGWWWSANESGRGFFIEWQAARATIAGYMYDDAGNPIWYIAVTDVTQPLAQNGTWLQFSGGQTLTGAFRPNQPVTPGPGPLSITFTSSTTATMTMPGGRTVALTRFRF